MAKKTVKRKRGRPPGKVGPYKVSFSQIVARLKVVEARLAKLEKVLN
jgi:hypothetical protein